MTKKERAQRTLKKRLIRRAMHARLRRDRVMFGGLGVTCVVFLSQLLTVTQLDWAQQAAVACFAVAIPLSAALTLEGAHESNELLAYVVTQIAYEPEVPTSNEPIEKRVVKVFFSVAERIAFWAGALAALIGIAFVFYHFSPTICWVFVGVVLLASLTVGNREAELDQNLEDLKRAQEAVAKKKEGAIEELPA